MRYGMDNHDKVNLIEMWVFMWCIGVISIYFCIRPISWNSLIKLSEQWHFLFMIRTICAFNRITINLVLHWIWFMEATFRLLIINYFICKYQIVRSDFSLYFGTNIDTSPCLSQWIHFFFFFHEQKYWNFHSVQSTIQDFLLLSLLTWFFSLFNWIHWCLRTKKPGYFLFKEFKEQISIKKQYFSQKGLSLIQFPGITPNHTNENSHKIIDKLPDK